MGKYETLKKKLCDELERLSNRELSMQSLETIDKLTHTIKNLNKIEESEEGGSYRGSYEGGSNRGSYEGSMSYDGAYDGGSYRRRDSMGRYARDGYSRRDVKDRLYEMMEQANDEKTKADLRKLISTMENN